MLPAPIITPVPCNIAGVYTLQMVLVAASTTNGEASGDSPGSHALDTFQFDPGASPDFVQGYADFAFQKVPPLTEAVSAGYCSAVISTTETDQYGSAAITRFLILTTAGVVSGAETVDWTDTPTPGQGLPFLVFTAWTVTSTASTFSPGGTL